MLNDPVLRNDWHVVAYAPDLKEGKPMAVRLLEEDIVLWRVGDKIHFPFVHQGYLGDPAHPEVNDYEAEISPDGVIARDIIVWQPDPDGSGRGANVAYTYTVVRPLTAYFVKSSAGPKFAMCFTVTPVAERTSIAWTYVAKDYENIPDEETQQ
jgi:phenylpropionate dioxygenase-like ring-hydroxylating dioxygenase large terminal subunit